MRTIHRPQAYRRSYHSAIASRFRSSHATDQSRSYEKSCKGCLHDEPPLQSRNFTLQFEWKEMKGKIIPRFPFPSLGPRTRLRPFWPQVGLGMMNPRPTAASSPLLTTPNSKSASALNPSGGPNPIMAANRPMTKPSHRRSLPVSQTPSMDGIFATKAATCHYCECQY